jgi:hypothetical protein
MRAGLAAADRALSLSGVRAWEAEVRRLRAGFLGGVGAPAPAVAAELRRALAVAHGQGARMLELRVAVSLLRQALERGDSRGASEARAGLAAIARALPEARDTPEWREADLLLAAPGRATAASTPTGTPHGTLAERRPAHP